MGSGQIINNQINLKLINIIQFCLKINDLSGISLTLVYSSTNMSK